MTDLQALFTQLDSLSPDEFAQVRTYFDELTLYAHPMRGKTPEERVALLREGLSEFREGLSEDELQTMTSLMNIEYVTPNEFHQFDWLDDEEDKP